MPNLTELVTHWGYLAIFVVVVLGNLGLPVPEETILALSGYLVWRGQLRLWLVILVGVTSAIAGDNMGYWFGRRYGQSYLERYGHWILGGPGRLESMRRFMSRHGEGGVFAARFIAGLRFLAGPLAGATGLRPAHFIVANTLGAIVYVPFAVGAGYAVGYGFGPYIERFRRAVGEVEHVVLILAILGTIATLGRRALQAARARQGS
ncbi:MAG TPA: DedA family protein [Candidatus Methylomirabilis sp.]|nr:DedA family protein [Candidatus Methylomirabilis sp.]HSC71375.1 DedA family protein [Candidatus Methylomirabilis sp.]